MSKLNLHWHSSLQCPPVGFLGGEPSPHLAAASCQVVCTGPSLVPLRVAVSAGTCGAWGMLPVLTDRVLVRNLPQLLSAAIPGWKAAGAGLGWL